MSNGSGAGFGPAVMAWFEAKVRAVQQGAVEVLEEGGEQIAQKTRGYIETRGTTKSGKRGRIETRAMLNSVDNETAVNTPELVEVRAGYHDAPYYTVFQELGTSRIEAMYALTDAAEEVLPDLQKGLAKVIDNA